MKSKAIIRNVIIGIVVIAIGAVGYSFISKQPAAPAATSSSGLATTAGIPVTVNTSASTAGATAAADGGSLAGADFLATLLSVKTITLDDGIFTNPAFTSLYDFNRPLLPDPNPGRPNPFAPLGADVQGASTQISTSNVSAITGTTSTMNGTLNVGDPTVMRWFAYGTSPTLLGLSTPQKPQTMPGVFAEPVTGLSPNTTYFARAMATIAGQTASGNLVTWTTAQTKR